VLRCSVVCCSALSVAVCCTVLQVCCKCVAVCCIVLVLLRVAMWCDVLQYDGCVLQCAAVCCSVLQCGAVCCSTMRDCKRRAALHEPMALQHGTAT